MVGRLRALLIEDDGDSRVLFGEVLADAGLSAQCIGPEELPAERDFDVVVSDLPVPSFGHYSSVAARDWVTLLRARYGVPVVVVTGHHEAVVDASLGVHVLQKPVDIDDFVARIRAAVDGARA